MIGGGDWGAREEREALAALAEHRGVIVFDLAAAPREFRVRVRARPPRRDATVEVLSALAWLCPAAAVGLALEAVDAGGSTLVLRFAGRGDRDAFARRLAGAGIEVPGADAPPPRRMALIEI